MRSTADENTSMSMSGEANTTAPISVRNGVAVSRIELAQASMRQHGAHAVRDDVDAAAAGLVTSREHAFEVVARPHRTFAVIGVVEQLAPSTARRRPSSGRGI